MPNLILCIITYRNHWIFNDHNCLWFGVFRHFWKIIVWNLRKKKIGTHYGVLPLTQEPLEQLVTCRLFLLLIRVKSINFSTGFSLDFSEKIGTFSRHWRILSLVGEGEWGTIVKWTNECFKCIRICKKKKKPLRYKKSSC